MEELIVLLRKANLMEEGALENVFKVYVKAKRGERYIIKSGFGAFVVVIAKYLENGKEMEQHWYRCFKLKQTEEMVFDDQTSVFLDHIIGKPDMHAVSATLYNCKKIV